jgi:hypothetical protein
MTIAKLLGVTALAAATLAVTIPSTAGAYDRYDRYERHHDRGRYERVRYDRGRHYRPHKVRVCHREWRHHHRVNVCRYVWR